MKSPSARSQHRSAALALSAAVPFPAAAQVAGRPITIIVPYSPGTGIDILARSIATDLSSRFGQPVVVDNRTGASGNIGTGMAARAAPDGNTLLMIAKVFVVNPSLFKSVPYDPVKSFDPIIKLATGTIVLAVHPSVPANDVREFVAYREVAAAGLGQLRLGRFRDAASSVDGAVQAGGRREPHAHSLQGHLGRDDRPDRQPRQRHVHPDPCRAAVHARQADPRARHRRPRTLGRRCRTSRRCTSRAWARSRTTSGSGSWRRPARRPEIVARFNTAINEIIRTKEMVASLAKQGLVVSGGGPEVLRDLIVKDRAKWAKVISDAGIKAE